VHAAPRESEWRWRGGRARTAPREARCVRLRQFRQRARGRERAGRGNRPSRTRPARAPRRSHRTARARAHAELCEKPLAPSGRRAEVASRPGNGTCGGVVPCRARCALSRLPVRAFSSLAGVSTTRGCGPVRACARPPPTASGRRAVGSGDQRDAGSGRGRGAHPSIVLTVCLHSRLGVSCSASGIAGVKHGRDAGIPARLRV
jgi:hypothetical protein